MKTKNYLITALILLFMVSNLLAQKSVLEPIGIGETMGDFTLDTYQGDKFSLNDYKDKNVMMIFPRGKVLPHLWCPICYYQYAEIAELNNLKKLEKKHNLKIVYVLSHPKDSIDAWRNAANKGLQMIENWKYPKGDSIPEGTLRWAEYVKEFFPKNYIRKDGKFDLPITILMDNKKELAKGLMLLKEEWGGTKVEQTMPTVFILDKEAKVRFKYHSQYTNDRPIAEYLAEVLEKMM